MRILRERLCPGGDLGPVVDGGAVAIGARRHRVELDEVDAPRSEKVNNRGYVFLRSGLGEIDLVEKRRGTWSTKGVAGGVRNGENVLDVIWRIQDRIVRRHSGL